MFNTQDCDSGCLKKAGVPQLKPPQDIFQGEKNALILVVLQIMFNGTSVSFQTAFLTEI